MNWYALFVETGKEEIVQKELRLRFKESELYSIVPKRKLPEKKEGKIYHIIKKMFPGYVLIRTTMNADIFHTINKISQCYKVLTYGTYYSKEKGSYYAKIEDHEIEILFRLIGSEEIVDFSEVYLENSKVYVHHGPLVGMENMILKVDRHKNRAKIYLDFLGTGNTMDVGIKVLEKLE